MAETTIEIDEFNRYPIVSIYFELVTVEIYSLNRESRAGR